MLCQHLPQPARLRDRKTAALRARAADDVTQTAGVRSAKARGDQPVIERLNRGGSHPAEQHVLIDGQTHRAIRIGIGKISQHTHLTGREIAERQTRDDMAVAVLPLPADVALHPAQIGVRQGLSA